MVKTKTLFQCLSQSSFYDTLTEKLHITFNAFIELWYVFQFYSTKYKTLTFTSFCTTYIQR